MPINHIACASVDANTLVPADHSALLHDQYQSGERDFADRDLEGVSLPASCLSYANLRRSRLKQANLNHADLRGIDLSEANLSRSDFQHADLRGAAMNDTMLFMASLDGANLQGADLSGASLDITSLTQANLQGANLCGTYLCGIDLSEANLSGAYFDHKTQFDPKFDPLAAGMQTEIQITIDDLINHLNQLSRCANRYLGSSMTSKYWEAARYNNRHLAAFYLDPTGHFSYSGPSAQPASLLQLKWTQLWMNKFLGSCAKIFQDLPDIAAQKHLLVVSGGTRD